MVIMYYSIHYLLSFYLCIPFRSGHQSGMNNVERGTRAVWDLLAFWHAPSGLPCSLYFLLPLVLGKVSWAMSLDSKASRCPLSAQPQWQSANDT
jgi:hypothetical protein